MKIDVFFVAKYFKGAIVNKNIALRNAYSVLTIIEILRDKLNLAQSVVNSLEIQRKGVWNIPFGILGVGTKILIGRVADIKPSMVILGFVVLMVKNALSMYWSGKKLTARLFLTAG